MIQTCLSPFVNPISYTCKIRGIYGEQMKVWEEVGFVSGFSYAVQLMIGCK